MFTVQQFCQMVDTNLNGFMRMLQAQSLTASAPNSYIEASRMLKSAINANPAVASVHLTSTSNLLVEYQLPQAAAYCDLVLLGAGNDRPQAIIIELKDYAPNTTDHPDSYEGLMWHSNQQGTHLISHPSDQVKGYVEYCRNFHSAVIQKDGTPLADVNGCVFFTQNNFNITPYTQSPNAQLANAYKLYTPGTSNKLAQYIANTIVGPNNTFASAFENGTFIQNRNIMMQVAQNMMNAAANGYRPFVLLDNQRKGLQQTMKALDASVQTGQKSVVIVQGPPGSGKSAVAINLYVEAIAKYVNSQAGNIFFVTTSASQQHNWGTIFTNAARLRNGMGAQKSAATFKPQHMGSTNALAPHFPHYMRNGKLDPSHYEEYVNFVMTLPQKEYGDNVDFLSIVDEAHALINPTSPYYIGHQQGFANYTGPQAYHIIRRSKVSVFFTDPDQSFRDFESTSIKDIEDFAAHLGAKVVHVDLGALQFRCAGSVDYIKWVDNVFTQDPVQNHNAWQSRFDVQLCKYPSDLEAILRQKMVGKTTARLLSSYSVEWVSQNTLHAFHHLSNAKYDFDLIDKNGLHWKKYWNNPDRYDIFVQATGPSTMNTAPLSEVGCPYVVRGFDYDYVGILMLDDIVWRKDHWVINIDNCWETATKSRRKNARKENKGKRSFDAIQTNKPQTKMFFDTIRQAYRILMTRGIKGMYLCIPDDETRNYIATLL